MKRTSLTSEPLLLVPPGALHRIDTSQIPADVTGGAWGACRLPTGGCTHDCEQSDRCTCGHTPPDPQAPDLIDRLGLDRRPLLSLALIVAGVLALIELAPVVAAALR